MRYPTGLSATTVALTAAVALTACGSTGSPHSSAGSSSNATGSSPAATTSTSGALSPAATPPASTSTSTVAARAATDYSRCMRTHGLPTFPRPVDGHIYLQATPDSPLDPRSPTYQKTAATCAKLVPAFHPPTNAPLMATHAP